MTIPDAIQLISSNCIDHSRPQQWADLGCGDGIFSKTLLRLLHKDSFIYAIDKQPASFKEERITFIQQDFENDSLSLPPLDGLMMANALHFVKNKPIFLQNIRSIYCRKASLSWWNMTLILQTGMYPIPLFSMQQPLYLNRLALSYSKK